ncbi:amidohydrolase family protein [Granulicella cerasi]|uniref:Amidohydrolase family protein n=1 Tax=Granulicella cerasi TaxID=741063 RepID=A0ABW1ZCR0_9BACT|nr:amidohydrolase family protein [Granulicella cerasi]
MNRRDFLTSGLAAAFASGACLPMTAEASYPESMLIRGACIVSLDAQLGMLDRGDILIERGVIRDVGRSLRAETQVVLDGNGLIALPGFVDTHWHMWNTLARAWAPTSGGTGFFPAMKQMSALLSPEDTAVSVELALAEAAACGITMVHNFAHNVRSSDHADAEIETMLRSGLRGRFSYGYPQDATSTQKMDFADITRVKKRFFADDGHLELGIATRGPERTPPAVWKEEWSFARPLELPVTTHVDVSRETAPKESVRQLAEAGVLDNRTMLVHLTQASGMEMARAARAGAPVAVTPWTEMRVGYGLTPWKQLREAGLSPSFGVDTVVLSGTADFFSIMRLVLAAEAGRELDQFAVSPAEVLHAATLGGAQAMGAGALTGSLTPGKAADILLLDGSALALTPRTDPVALLAESAQSATIRHVLSNGRFIKRDGVVQGIDLPALRRRASRSWSRIHEQLAKANSQQKVDRS